MSEIISIFDNEGKTFDRYTIVDSDNDMIGMSENPSSPLGFDQYCGQAPKGISLSSCLGKKIPKNKWPEQIVQAYKQRINQINKQWT